ncbi:hypothetical protein PVL29_011644 [Vitis rotundifolia]|uniref:SPX domain-containing protein n=1 Tax=Vitis rotundifolia TaxID=103349 RepID=A0AA38ZPP1_VITRO|nr:hypothetical protein PVL29_011644 [Vitis rotundifolia]
MKFGKRLCWELEETIPEWKSEFISYKQLKKLLNQIDLELWETDGSNKRPSFSTFDCLGVGGRYVHMMREDKGFIRLFEGEIEKVNTFFVDKEEDYIIKVKELQEMVANLDVDGDILEVQMHILDFHREMVSLLHYSLTNFTGFMKIVKKHNKKIVEKQRQHTVACHHIHFMPKVMQQPFFSTDLLYKLMKECETMLHHLFLISNPPDHSDDDL